MSWPGQDAIRKLTRLAAGTFIWAATNPCFVESGCRQFARQQLASILDTRNSSNVVLGKTLDSIYTTILVSSLDLRLHKHESKQLLSVLQGVMGTMITLFSSLSVRALVDFLYSYSHDIIILLQGLYSVLDISENEGIPFRLHHLSFRSFLQDSKCCHDEHFFMDAQGAHQLLAGNCMKVMKAALTRDGCGLHDPAAIASKANEDLLMEYLPEEY
jgi:hypothetical protein